MSDTLARPGWYPDPEGGTRLRWWDGEEWLEHYRGHPVLGQVSVPGSTTTAAAGAAATMAGVDADRILAQAREAARIEVSRSIDDAQAAARSEIDRVMGEVRRQVDTTVPLISDAVGEITKWGRRLVLVAVLAFVAWIAFQVLAGIGTADLIRDVVDAVNDDLDEDGAPLVSQGRVG